MRGFFFVADAVGATRSRKSRRSASNWRNCASDARFIGLSSTPDSGAWRSASAGSTVRSNVSSSALNSHTGKSSLRSRSSRTRRVRDSAGMRCSSRKRGTASASSVYSCRLTGALPSAVPSSTGPTRRGSKSAKNSSARSAASRRARRPRGLRVAEEQALILAQRILDLAIARQRGVVVDAEPLRGLELGLVEVADAAFGHQPGRFVGEAVATFADAGLGVLTGVVMHGTTLRV